MNTNTKLAAFLLNALLALAFVSIVKASDNPLGNTVEKLPGYGINGKCLYFARAAVVELHKLGIKSARVVSFVGHESAPTVFSLTSFAPSAPVRYSHAVVLFERDGQTFAFDNIYAHGAQRVGKPGQNQSDFACVERWYPNVDRLTAWK